METGHPQSSILVAPKQIEGGLHPRRVLVRSTNWLGDAVMTTPALLRLREKFPDAHITLLTPEKLRDLWRQHPSIDSVITFTAGEGPLSVALKLRPLNFKRFFYEIPEVEPNDTPWRVFVRFANTLSVGTSNRRLGFDLALVLPNSPRSALEVWLARIPQRIGYARSWRNWFLTTRVAPRPDAVKMRKHTPAEIHQLINRTVSEIENRKSKIGNASAHQIHEYLHLVAALGANPEPLPPALFVAPDEIEAAKKKFGLNVIGRTIFGLNPGAEYGPAKRWPVEKFIAAAREIQQRTNCVWLIFGGKGDIALTGQIAAALHASRFTFHDLSGRTSLRELMALLKLCRVLLTNDSGPMHAAAALGTPVVVPFGSTSPELTGPGLPGDPRHRLLKSDAPCAPCFLRKCPIDFRCLNGISVERVVEAVLETLR
ncbi:MAG: lipopolysaccharide heptosyltransferase II [Verrucomicrobiia bacterium]|jgi:heptosyltransferase-2